jgi:hypothetical protein
MHVPQVGGGDIGALDDADHARRVAGDDRQGQQVALDEQLEGAVERGDL